MKLTKGSSIVLAKDTDTLSEVTIGCSWGTKSDSIDIDTMVFKVSLGDSGYKIADSIYYGNKMSDGIKHYGDDTTGSNKQHDSDNEVIYLNLAKISRTVNSIPVVIDSYTHHNLIKIPWLKIRIYAGKPGEVQEILGTFEVKSSSVKNIKEAYSILIGEIYRDVVEWKFKSVGKFYKANRLTEIRDILLKSYYTNYNQEDQTIQEEVQESVSTCWITKIKNFFS